MILQQSFGAFFILNLSEINSTSISAECGLELKNQEEMEG